MQALDQHPAGRRIEGSLQGAGSERRRRTPQAHQALARGQLDIGAADSTIGRPAHPAAAVHRRIEDRDRSGRPHVGKHPGGIQPRGGNLHQGPLEPDLALRLHLQSRLADAHVARRLQAAAGLVEADVADVASPTDGSRHLGQGDVAVGKLELLQEAERPADLRATGQVTEEAPEVAGGGAGRAGGRVTELIAPLGRDAHRREEILDLDAPRRGAEAQQRAGRQARLEPLGAQNRTALPVRKIDAPELETQGMGWREPGDLDGADAGAAPRCGRGQPALGHRPERAGGDVALRQPPRGETGDESQPHDDAEHGRRDMSDGWPQQAGLPLPRSLACSPARLCASARRPA